MDEFLKRLWITAAFLLFSLNMIHLLMWVSGGYSKNWLFILTGKLIWFEFWDFKIETNQKNADHPSDQSLIKNTQQKTEAA